MCFHIFNNDGTAIVEGILLFFIQDKSASQCDTLHILLKKPYKFGKTD